MINEDETKVIRKRYKRRTAGVEDRAKMDAIIQKSLLKSSQNSIKIESLPNAMSIIIPNLDLLTYKRRQRINTGSSALITIIIIILSYLSADEFF